MVEASPDTSILEFQDLVLETLRRDDDELTRRLTSVKLLLGEKELQETSATLAESGIHPDTAVIAVFSRRIVQCASKQDADCDWEDPKRLLGVRIPDGTAEVQTGAFRGCTSILNLSIPDSVVKIGDEAFSGCESLASLEIPNSVTCIEPGAGAFNGCSSLTSLTIPESVTRIENRAFDGCSSVTSLTIPDSVISIGYNAFGGCSSLMTLTIPQRWSDQTQLVPGIHLPARFCGGNAQRLVPGCPQLTVNSARNPKSPAVALKLNACFWTYQPGRSRVQRFVVQAGRSQRLADPYMP